MFSVVYTLPGALLWHAVMVNNLSLAMGRYRGPWGRIVNSITWHPLHLVGLALIVVAGLLLAIPVPDPILPYWLGLCAFLATADDVLIYRAIKIVDRFSD